MSYSTIQLLQNTTFVFVNTEDGVPKQFELPDPQTCPGRILGFKGQGGPTPFTIQTTTSTLSHTIPYEARLLLNDGKTSWHTLASYTEPLETSFQAIRENGTQATEIPSTATILDVDLRSQAKTLQLPLTPESGRILILKDSQGACQGDSTLTLLTHTSSLTLSDMPFVSMILATDSTKQWQILHKNSQHPTVFADLSGSFALSLPTQGCCVTVEPSTLLKTLCLPPAASSKAGDLFCILGSQYNISTVETNTLDLLSTPQTFLGPLVLTPDGLQNWMLLSQASS